MSDKEIIKSILSFCPNVTTEEILEALIIEKNKTAGLITDETLLRLIASRHGVKIPPHTATDCSLLISQLVPKLNNVTISGRIMAIFPAKTFEGKQPGKYASLLIADKSGILRVMLWNSQADSVESGMIAAGQIIRFSRGYTREDRNGKTELHISEKGEIEVLTENLHEEYYPRIDNFVTAIKDVALPQQSVHLFGRVKAIYPSSNFTRQDNSIGKVLRFTMADNTSDVLVVAWNDKAETLDTSLKPNIEIKLVNAKVRIASDNRVEVHVDESTYVELPIDSKQS